MVRSSYSVAGQARPIAAPTATARAPAASGFSCTQSLVAVVAVPAALRTRSEATFAVDAADAAYSFTVSRAVEAYSPTVSRADDAYWPTACFAVDAYSPTVSRAVDAIAPTLSRSPGSVDPYSS